MIFSISARSALPVQVNRFKDAVKVTTLEPKWKNIRLYRMIGESIWDSYLERLGYHREDFITDT
jgi:predicted secreted Zn-dependent protease